VLIVPIDEAEPGMILACNVPHPENPQRDLLKRGFVLDGEVLKRLRSIGVNNLHVDYPGLEDLDQHLLPRLEPVRRAVYDQIKSTIVNAERSSSPIADFSGYKNATRSMIETLLDQGHHPLYMDTLSARLGADAVAHATAVAHLSLVIGLRSQEYLIQSRNRLPPKHASDVVNLGVAGMLHDIGKTKLPTALRAGTAIAPPSVDADRAAWEAHGQLGYEMIKGSLEPSASAAVLNHHQHFDGSGFPVLPTRDGGTARPGGESIHVFARILQLADLFDHLSAAPSSGRRTNVEILHLLRSRYGSWLDPRLLAQVPRIIPPFPPGSKVRLSDRRDAVVTAINIEDPYHPTVKRLAPEGKTVEPEPLRLGLPSGLRIVQFGSLAVDPLLPPLAAA
jgi:HD-GYP domain-containing protein (c-di-GMP phosphodiesterase class II)